MRSLFVIGDVLAALLGWGVFFVLRKYIELGYVSALAISGDHNFWLGAIFMVFFWAFLWWSLGTYHDIKRQTRSGMVYKTIAGVLIGSLVILLTLMVDDLTLQKITYVHSGLLVASVFLISFLLFRIPILTVQKMLFARGKLFWRGAWIGSSDDRPQFLFTKFEERPFSGHVEKINQEDYDVMCLRGIDNPQVLNALPLVIGKAGDQILLVHEREITNIPSMLFPQPYYGQEYLSLRTSPLSDWQTYTKRVVDMILSVALLLLLFPILIIVGVLVMRSVRASVIFSQERIGKNGKPFQILKFRTMYPDAEKEGPRLATADDPRCTPIGKMLRKWRLDELPQLWNVLKGDMSFVGPRPERYFYARQLIQREPQYPLLWQVKPGLTSWGQIKFGYASTIEEMVTRFRYDLQYLQSMSMLLDLRVLYYTIKVLWSGKGK